MGRASVTWSAAVTRGERLCCDETYLVRTDPRTEARRQRAEQWALLVYAIAGEAGRPVSEVTLSQMRYRLDDRETFVRWLFRRLLAMGHQVEPPITPDPNYGSDPEALLQTGRIAVENLLKVWDTTDAPQADDPVVNRWRRDSLVTRLKGETSDGMIFDEAPECDLWTFRRDAIAVLDALLIIDRGGWTAGTRVRTVRFPGYRQEGPSPAYQSRYAADRAVVDSPVWGLDQFRPDLVPGPPVAYRLRYRALPGEFSSVCATSRPTEPVSPKHFLFDSDPFPDPPGSHVSLIVAARHIADQRATSQPAAGRSTPTIQPATEPAIEPAMTQTSRAGGSPRPATDRAADPVAGLDGDPPAGEVYDGRSVAIKRLWQLRDTELRAGGDSAPDRVAVRAANDPYSQRQRPPLYKELIDEENYRNLCVLENSLGAVPDRQLVTGGLRPYLSQWITQLTSYDTTKRQHEALGDLDREATVEQLRLFMASEGFTEVLTASGPDDRGFRAADIHYPDVHSPGVHHTDAAHDRTDDTLTRDVDDRDLADPARGGSGSADANASTGRDQASPGTADRVDRMDLVFVSPEIGIATAHAIRWLHRPEELYVRRVDIHYNVEVIDQGLTILGGSYRYGRDENDRPTHVRCGTLHWHPSVPAGSLRVRLAVMRAFTRPVLPWRYDVLVTVGDDGTPAQERIDAIDRLPGYVRDLFGPCIYPQVS